MELFLIIPPRSAKWSLTLNPSFWPAGQSLLCPQSHLSLVFLWLMLCGSWLSLCASGSESPQHSCFLVSFDPAVTHFLFSSHPAMLAPGRQTIHPVPQRFPMSFSVIRTQGHTWICHYNGQIVQRPHRFMIENLYDRDYSQWIFWCTFVRTYKLRSAEEQTKPPLNHFLSHT